jgi:aspartate ammonia-lyase
MGLARAENLVEATQNADVYVEVSGILRAVASNLLKTATDLRLLSSGPEAGWGEIRLPVRQAGSSIMPAKVNPVIPEAVSQAAIAVLGYDQAIVHASSAGNLELNQFLPLVADCLLTALDLLDRACDIFARHCVQGIRAREDRCRKTVLSSTATLTALVERIGYEQACLVSAAAADQRQSIRELVVQRGILTAEEFDQLVSPEQVMRLGTTRSPPTIP